MRLFPMRAQRQNTMSHVKLFLALVCALLSTLPAVQCAADANPPAAAGPLRCPASVKQLVDNAPEESVAEVKRACNPSTNANFCQSCICTVASNFVPATLTAAGILTSTTSPTAAEEIIGSCAPSSHVALLKLGALTEDWSQALNTKCDDDASIAELSCEQYVPKSLPVKKAVTKEAGPVNEGDSCPFQAEDIRTEELASARKACAESGNKTVLLMSAGVNSTDSSFCKSCLCTIQSTLDAIVSRRQNLLAASGNSTGDDIYKECYIILTQALVEGDVLTPDAAGVLGSDECRPMSQLSTADRKAACGSEFGAKNATATGAGPAQKSSGGVVEVHGVVLALASLFALWASVIV